MLYKGNIIWVENIKDFSKKQGVIFDSENKGSGNRVEKDRD